MDYLITKKIIGAAIEVHKTLGPGLLEKTYRECLAYELIQRNILTYKEVDIPVEYKEVEINCGFRLDLLVENRIVVEIKAVKQLEDIHLAQILTYLKLTGHSVGLLINFNVPFLTNGIKRVVNNFD